MIPQGAKAVPDRKGAIFTRLLLAGARLLGQDRTLWVWGCLLALGVLAGLFQSSLLDLALRAAAADPGALAARLTDFFERPWPLFASILGLFVLFSLFWLLAVSAEGALIYQVDAVDGGRPAGLTAAWREGRRLVPRFIAIDTVLFLPVFLVILFMMVSTTAGLVGFGLAIVSGAELRPAVIAGAIGLLLEILLLVAAAVVMLVTLIWRTLAFRLAALNQTGARQSIRAAGLMLRRNWVAIAGFYLLLWASRRLAMFLVAALSAPLALLLPWAALIEGKPPLTLSPLFAILSALLVLLRWLLLSAWHAHAGAVWTLAVIQWQQPERV